MTSIAAKAVHVAAAPNNDRQHHCHWPDCTKPVKPAMFMCKAHWYTLPQALRNKIWIAYEPGQEVSKTPTAEYLAVVREVMQWVKEHQPHNELFSNWDKDG